MQVIITRPADDAKLTADQVAGLGFEPVIAPLTRIKTLSPPLPDQHYNALIITSRHALDGVRSSDLARLVSLPLYVVGQATAIKAQKAGFEAITKAIDARDLVPMILKAHHKEQSLLYLAGEPRKSHIEDKLKNHLSLQILLTYCSESVDAFPDAALHMINDPQPIWLHYSEQSAKRAATLAQHSRKPDLFLTARHLVLSASIAQCVSDLGGTDITCAARPEQSALLASLLTMRQ